MQSADAICDTLCGPTGVLRGDLSNRVEAAKAVAVSLGLPETSQKLMQKAVAAYHRLSPERREQAAQALACIMRNPTDVTHMHECVSRHVNAINAIDEETADFLVVATRLAKTAHENYEIAYNSGCDVSVATLAFGAMVSIVAFVVALAQAAAGVKPWIALTLTPAFMVAQILSQFRLARLVFQACFPTSLDRWLLVLNLFVVVSTRVALSMFDLDNAARPIFMVCCLLSVVMILIAFVRSATRDANASRDKCAFASTAMQLSKDPDVRESVRAAKRMAS